MFSRLYQPSTSVSMSWEQWGFFFFFFCRYTPPDVRVPSHLSAHICVCVFMRMCVKHVGVRLQTSVFVPVICVCPCISVSLCVFAWTHRHRFVLWRWFSFPTVRFLGTLCTCSYVHEFGVYRCTSACKKQNRSLTMNELLLQLPAAAL